VAPARSPHPRPQASYLQLIESVLSRLVELGAQAVDVGLHLLFLLSSISFGTLQVPCEHLVRLLHRRELLFRCGALLQMHAALVDGLLVLVHVLSHQALQVCIVCAQGVLHNLCPICNNADLVLERLGNGLHLLLARRPAQHTHASDLSQEVGKIRCQENICCLECARRLLKGRGLTETPGLRLELSKFHVQVFHLLHAPDVGASEVEGQRLARFRLDEVNLDVRAYYVDSAQERDEVLLVHVLIVDLAPTTRERDAMRSMSAANKWDYARPFFRLGEEAQHAL
jgi:hypothetical protein